LVCYIRKYLIILGDIPVDVPQPKYWDVSPASPAGLTPVVPANHVVLVRLTLGQFILWPKSPPNAGFGIKNLKKILGVTLSDPLSGRGRLPPAPSPSTATCRARGRKLPRCWDLGLGNRSPNQNLPLHPWQCHSVTVTVW